jgi:hypothetical protein
VSHPPQAGLRNPAAFAAELRERSDAADLTNPPITALQGLEGAGRVKQASTPASRAAAAVCDRYDVRARGRGAKRKVEPARIAALIEREAELAELLQENERLHEIKRGAFRAAEELRKSNAQLLRIAARAERWIRKAIQAAPGSRVDRLDLADGRALAAALAAALGRRSRISDRSAPPPSPQRYRGT